MNKDDSENTTYKVVVNHEGQYSIWVTDRTNPSGWRDAAKSGSKSECLAYIQEAWTDMRPLTLQNKMDKPATVLKNSNLHLNGNHKKAVGPD